MRAPGTTDGVLAVTGYVLAAGAALAALATVGVGPVPVLLLAALALGGLASLTARLLGRPAREVQRIASDAEVVATTNPAHRAAGSDVAALTPLVEQVNRLASALETARRDAESQARAVRGAAEADLERLAALTAELSVPVLVCNAEGRILLYNEVARTLLGGPAHVGLGRSVFAVVDRALVSHARDRLTTAPGTVYVATTVHQERLLHVRVALVRGTEETAGDVAEPHGFVLVLEDLTAAAQVGEERTRLLRRLAATTRNTLEQLDALAAGADAALRAKVSEVVDDATREVDELVALAAEMTDDRLLTEISADDLLSVLHHELREAGASVSSEPPPDDLWVRADAHAVARCLHHLDTRLRAPEGTGPAAPLVVTLAPVGRRVRLEARWSVAPPPESLLAGWLREPLDGNGTAVHAVADRHGADVGLDPGPGVVTLSMLLPLTTGGPAASPVRVTVDSRPEYYDFDLFDATRPADVTAHRLDELAFTVIDTETTGLDPAAGDRIVSLGAVRVVNGRVLRHETYERLVQPGRRVPRTATAIHGITDDMLRDQPTLEEVLPELARFCEDTVLVGHNIGFDLQFLRPAETAAGASLPASVLDTLLLDAALHPAHDDHTLEGIAARLGVSIVGRHTALGDALVTAEVFSAQRDLLLERGVATLAEALAVSRDSYHARRDERMYER